MIAITKWVRRLLYSTIVSLVRSMKTAKFHAKMMETATKKEVKGRSHVTFFSPCPFFTPLLFNIVSMLIVWKTGTMGPSPILTISIYTMLKKNGPFNGLTKRTEKRQVWMRLKMLFFNLFSRLWSNISQHVCDSDKWSMIPYLFLYDLNSEMLKSQSQYSIYIFWS